MENTPFQQTTAPYSEVFKALGCGATVVTVNKRLSSIVLKAFETAAINRGLQAWRTPDVLPWSAWLQRSWEQVSVSDSVATSINTPHAALVLSPLQEQCLWEKIIRKSLSYQPLQQVSGTVRRVQEAWQLIHAWQLPLDENTFQYNLDSLAFWAWAAQFKAQCKDKHWLPMATLATKLRRHYQSAMAQSPACPDTLILLGFDELNPQQQSLLQVLADVGRQIHWWQLSPDPVNNTKVAVAEATAIKVACMDSRQEATTLARWAKQKSNANPQATIGIVVQEFTTQRDLLAQALDNVFVPQALYPGQQSLARPYNLSLGLPLSHYPIIITAFNLLSLFKSPISVADMGFLLRSPFIVGGREEASERALLDARLREAGEQYLTLKNVRYYATQTDKPYSCPLLVEHLAAWQAIHTAGTLTQCPSLWPETWAKCLHMAGWGQGRSLSSEEYQTTEAWQELLKSFASLDIITANMTAGQALSQLRRMAAERTFQPQAGEGTVQVLGVLEASGLHFDHLWIMGWHDGVWPPSPHANPFIPLPLQREKGLPHSSETRELQLSQRISQRLLGSAPQVVVSFPQYNGDEVLRPSPLVAALPLEPPESLDLAPLSTWRDEVHKQKKLSPLNDDPAPPLESLNPRDDTVRGGSAVFKLQAACPFRAFAELRLNAKALREADIGLDAMTRGSLMHRVLENVWKILESQQQLLTQIKNDTLLTTVQRCVDEAVSEAAKQHPHTLTGRFLSLEKQRLEQQILAWLELEKQRPPFHVSEREGKHVAAAGGVRVRLKIDRIDSLDNGKKILIDYKTGQVKPSQWFGERPEEPQLPLYSMAVEGDIAGVVFAQIKAGNMAFNGISEQTELLPKVKPYNKLQHTKNTASWPQVLRDWQATMAQLGHDFQQGNAAVDPKQHPKTCEYCDLTPLCRVHEKECH